MHSRGTLLPPKLAPPADIHCHRAGITVLNEVGADPGVDRLYAVKTIGEVHEKGGQVR